MTLITRWLDAPLSQLVVQITGRKVSSHWPVYFHLTGIVVLFLGLAIVAAGSVRDGYPGLKKNLHSAMISNDIWWEQKLAKWANLVSLPEHQWPVKINLSDWVAIIFFLFLALITQISSASHGFPNVILGGDAANIASFAAGRAYPQLFGNDAILGDLGNIGLYTTIHLPISIWLEKLVGNFGLAFSLLVFPHVFLQYFSYYLLGRVLFTNRYWAFLFTLAVSAPLTLAGGELWGVVADGMPRFTFQVLIPFMLILLLTTWGDRPGRWPWVMVISGLMAFIHPVSTPAWAFALWLGLWPCMPSFYNLRGKLLEMLKMGFVLALALLPYISIYLYFHKSGVSNSNYDLVYLILTNYFPYDLLNIPAAVKVLLSATSQFGLLWYGLIGLALTFLLFRFERSRLQQMITWMAGISFVSILVPYVEQIIERSFRLIPLQTELMRGMRYLIPFLFIFWFYPLAELTNRSLRKGLTRSVLLVGTLLTMGWLGLNPPIPFTQAPTVFQCWSQAHFICPTDTAYADALTFIRNETPEKAQFVVFLQNRWSGIEVRYLGLRPMAYAYKDRGQLTFTNLEALKTWYYYLRRENVIFSKNLSPKLRLKQQRMVKFALDARVNFLLTDFPFPPEAQKWLDVSAVYQKGGFTILKIYDVHK